MSTNVDKIDGNQLVDRLLGVQDLRKYESRGYDITFFEASDEEPIAEAQLILEALHYHLSDWEMIEGSFYQVTYTLTTTGEGYWPNGVILRLVAHRFLSVQLALVYQKNVLDTWHRFVESGYNQTCNTHTPAARMMWGDCRKCYPLLTPKWYPIINGYLPADFS